MHSNFVMTDVKRFELTRAIEKGYIDEKEYVDEVKRLIAEGYGVNCSSVYEKVREENEYAHSAKVFQNGEHILIKVLKHKEAISLLNELKLANDFKAALDHILQLYRPLLLLASLKDESTFKGIIEILGEHCFQYCDAPLLCKLIENGWSTQVNDLILKSPNMQAILFTQVENGGFLPIDLALKHEQVNIIHPIRDKTVDLISQWLKGICNPNPDVPNEFKYFKNCKKSSKSIEICIEKVKVFENVAGIIDALKDDKLKTLHNEIKSTKYYKDFRHALKSNMIEVIQNSESSPEEKISLLTQLKDHLLFSEQRHNLTARSETSSQKDFKKAIQLQESIKGSKYVVQKNNQEVTAFLHKQKQDENKKRKPYSGPHI